MMELTPLCYCGSTVKDEFMLACQKCKRLFHMECLKNGKPSPLEGDIFFTLTCADCSPINEEECNRMKLQWLPVVMLALYNLQKSGAGKRGYFRWKEHICAFIDKHWNVFFGYLRKKTHTWYGTVAGTLSSGCPVYFNSGAQELRESGWWKLAENKPPPIEIMTANKSGKRFRTETKELSPQKVEGLRTRRNKTSIQSAMELRARRDTLKEAKEIRKAKTATPSPSPASASDSRSLSIASLDNSLDSISMASFSSGLSSPVDPVPLVTSAPKDRAEDGYLSPMETSQFSTGSASLSGSFLHTDLLDQSSQMSVSSCKSDQFVTTKDLIIGDKIPDFLLEDDEDGNASDLEIDPCALSPDHSHNAQGLHSSADPLPQMEELLSTLEAKVNSANNISARAALEQVGSDSSVPPRDMSHDSNDSAMCLSYENSPFLARSVVSEPTEVSLDTQASANTSSYDKIQKEAGRCENEARDDDVTADHNEADEEGEESSSDSSDEEGSQTTETSCEGARKVRKRKRGLPEDDSEPVARPPSPKCMQMSVYEELQLYKKLQSMDDVVSKCPEAARLRRKLAVRKMKREKGYPVFDIDEFMNRLMGQPPEEKKSDEFDPRLNPYNLPMSRFSSRDYRILDRFQTGHAGIQRAAPVSFLNRLVGTEDDQLRSITSPYTARTLKPFIRRDYESRPRKLCLLEEIVAYPHRSDPSWTAPKSNPIDFCYVQPQHIPSVNALCREFFWPGIDLSECLQYPDFSCVVLYRKFVIGFAFMVPDVKFNEAYISFIFTHPEWRGAGIATFMLYHLIQTCMGKDVTLHVSASNSAMLLYQKFGFKPEEFIIDFYDKYFPLESSECRHAFFLRLRR